MDSYPPTVSAGNLQKVITLMQDYAGPARGMRADTLIVPAPG